MIVIVGPEIDLQELLEDRECLPSWGPSKQPTLSRNSSTTALQTQEANSPLEISPSQRMRPLSREVGGMRQRLALLRVVSALSGLRDFPIFLGNRLVVYSRT